MASTTPANNLRWPRTLSLLALRSEAQRRRLSIFRNRDALRRLLEVHGGSVETRWAKQRKKNKMSETLEAAWRDIPAGRLLDSPRLNNQSQSAENSIPKACLCPTINIDDPITDNVILESAYHRAESDPCDLVGLDLANTAIEIQNDQPRSAYDGFRMKVWSQRTADVYGDVVGVSAVVDQSTVHLALGLFILEIQDHIYWFHLKFVETLLGPELEQERLEASGPMVSLTERINNQILTLAETTLRASYMPRAPGMLQRLETQAKAECTKYVHVLAETREDPKHFTDAVAYIKDRSNQNKSIPTTGLVNIESEYVTATMSALTALFDYVNFWNYVSNKFGKLAEMEQRGTLSNGRSFTNVGNIVFCTLAEYLHESLNQICDNISPRNNSSSRTAHASRGQPKLAELVNHLDGAPDRTFHGVFHVASQIQKFLDSNLHTLSDMPEEKQRTFSQFLLSAGLLRQLYLLNPAAAWTDTTLKAAENEIKYRNASISVLHTRLAVHCRKHDLNPTDTKFDHPTIPKTPEARERRTAVVKAFGEFFVDLDKALGHDTLEPSTLPDDLTWFKDPKRRNAVLEGPYVEARNLRLWNRQYFAEHETANGADEDFGEEYEDQVAEPQDSTKAEVLQAVPDCARVTPGSGVTEEAPRRFVPIFKPEKPRTTGVAIVEAPEVVNDQVDEQRREKVNVDGTTRQMLQIAFKCHVGKPPGEFDFKDLLNMMCDVGFKTTQNASGYAFAHRDGPIPVSLHRPHKPSSGSKLSNKALCIFLGRLERQCDWFRKDRFDLDD